MGKKLIWFFVTMMAIVSGVSIIASSVHADSLTLTTSDGMTFVLRDSPCGEEISDLLKDEYREQFKGATASYAGLSIEMCWTGPDSDNDMILIDKTGSGIAVPMEKFMRASAVTTPRLPSDHVLERPANLSDKRSLFLRLLVVNFARPPHPIPVAIPASWHCWPPTLF